MTEHVLLVGHGTVESLDDLPGFLSNIRRGRPTPPEMVAEVRRRYLAIGGRSPLLDISRAQAAALSSKIQRPVHVAMRLWQPYVRDIVEDIIARGCTDLRVVALAPYSASVYTAEVERVVEERGPTASRPRLHLASNWGTVPSLVRAFARELNATLDTLPPARRTRAHVLMTAHSLPLAVLERGDRYDDEVRITAEAVVAAAKLDIPYRLSFQSQGMSNEPWLGPPIREALEGIAAAGGKDVVVCPIGFLTDHIEILYDLDIEARAIAEGLGLSFHRTASLNSSPDLVDALAEACGL